ncbi:diguanylate cyclase [Mycolicibacterium hodleri]|uniref:Diguanylate cyclase n=1 Tax=Mycolicibacterium hodleri TaxID=49897 RepID=A0A502ELA2_9MYCO|nr:diguanylate cyclase [Mycolicibacterium hodleri]TPG37081.1 diguanylate cyclase [Mycolicibacterium hodleri]
MEERRNGKAATDTEGYLRQLPALTLLNRLPTAMLGVELLGDIGYANPACAEMLGYLDPEKVARQSLPALLSGHETRTPADCVDLLRTTTSVVSWNHEEGYLVRTMLSPPLLLRATDTLLLIGITDVTASLWSEATQNRSA